MFVYTILTLLLVILVNICMKFYKLFKQRQNNAVKFKDFPGPPPHWLYGNLGEMAYEKGLYNGIAFAAKYGPAYTLHIGPFEREVVFTTPEFIKVLLNVPDEKSLTYRLLSPWLGDGLLLSKGKKWARNRKLLTPGFHFDILKPYQSIFSSSVSVMVGKWGKVIEDNPWQSVELFEHVSLMTLDSLMKCIFGVDENFQVEGHNNPYINSVYKLSTLMIKRFLCIPHHNDLVYYFSYNGYQNRQALKTAHKYSHDVITLKKQEKLTSNREKDKKYLDFLDILMDCRDEDGKGLTQQEIRDEVDTFMFEGHDTATSGLSWLLYNMARHPKYQEKCRKEIQEVLGERNEVKWEDLSKLSYITMCIKESLRLYPPVVFIGRYTANDLTLPNGRVLPRKTLALIDMNALHHNPKLWHNPEIYDPERFTPDKNAERDPHAYIPFSAGPRNCIGQHFALNELKTSLALILQKYRLYLDGSKPAEPMPELITRAKNGLWIRLELV